MRKHGLWLALLLTLSACDAPPRALPTAPRPYPTVRYLDLQLGPGGALPRNPYVLHLRAGPKELVFCGTNHLEDLTLTQHPLYTAIAREFHAFRPEVAINEGGDVSAKHYPSRDSAVRVDGEIGLLKVLADSARIATLNGDMADSAEYPLLLRRYPVGEVVAYIVTERLMWACVGGFRKGSLADTYAWFVGKHLVGRGLPLTPAQQSLAYYAQQYAKLVGRPFDLATLEPTNPFRPNSRFQDIGRASKELRDQHLIGTIDRLLGQHDRVFVVFGGWHLLTCAPGLRAVVARRGGGGPARASGRARR